MSFFPRFFGHESKNIPYSLRIIDVSLLYIFTIPEAVIMSKYTCVTSCGCPISSYVFSKMMTSPPVTKHPPVSASAVEAAINVKILQFACIGPFRRSRANFKGILHKNSAVRLRASVSVKYYASVLARKIMSEE